MEVEVKLVCQNLTDLRKKLLKMGAILVKTKRQIDVYYDHPAKVLVKNGEYLRVRKAASQKILGHHINIANGVNDECEVEMKRGGKIEELLKRLGFPKLGTIDKKREQYHLNNFKIFLDRVIGIGNFLEIEMEVKKGSELEAQKKCWELAQKLGFSQKDEFGFWLCDVAVGKIKWTPKKN